MAFEIKINNHKGIANILGVNDQNLKIFKEYLGIDVSVYGDKVICNTTDENKKQLKNIFQVLETISDEKISLSARDVIYIVNLSKTQTADEILKLYKNKKKITTTKQGKSIYPKTFNQIEYIKSMENYDLVFGVGPAGTGKTYLAVAMAVKNLKEHNVKKIIITRPAVEAGESLGFLPGDLKDKVDPYLIPIYDALYEMLGPETTTKYIENNVIEIAPLAYMRGRTLNDAFVILDEAQNTTEAQMKMFLTRLGFNSKMVVTGDPSQIDLPVGKKSGLRQALKILKNLSNSKILWLDKIDVIRHPLVQKIVERYETWK